MEGYVRREDAIQGGGRERRGVDVSEGGVEVEACCWVYIPRSNVMFNIIYTI